MTNDNPTPPSWTRRIILIVVTSGVLAILAALAWPPIGKPLGLAAGNLSRFWAAIIVATTFSITCFVVYFVAKKSLWEFLDILIIPLALAIIGFGFTFIQDNRQQKIEDQRAESAIKIEERRAQNAALQAYLDQMTNLILDRKLLEVNKGVPVHEPGDPVYTLAQARTTTAITQFDGEHNQAVTRFLSDSGLLEKPALLIEAGLEEAELPKAVLPEANLAGTKLKGANLADAMLIDADFSDVKKVGENPVEVAADLTQADLSKAALQGASLSLCNLQEATLTDAALQSADLRGATLQEADLSYATLQSANLSSAALQGVPPGRTPPKIPTNLTDADLSYAALQSADLSNADLTDADLTDANLTDAVLHDTTLSGALLGGADLSGADLTNTAVTQEQLDKAEALEGATMPNGQKYEDWLKDRKGHRGATENPGPS